MDFFYFHAFLQDFGQKIRLAPLSSFLGILDPPLIQSSKRLNWQMGSDRAGLSGISRLSHGVMGSPTSPRNQTHTVFFWAIKHDTKGGCIDFMFPCPPHPTHSLPHRPPHPLNPLLFLQVANGQRTWFFEGLCFWMIWRNRLTSALCGDRFIL